MVEETENNIYEHVGNFENYEHERRLIKPVGIVKSPNLVLKMYAMWRGSEAPTVLEINDSKNLVNKLVSSRKISPESGLGFAIRSDGVLNVAKWDVKDPIILKNQVFKLVGQEKLHAEPWDLKDAGSFCIWELGIVNHERKAWMRYLQTEMGEENKEHYLNDRFMGEWC